MKLAAIECWHLNTSSNVVVPNARMHVYIIEYRTMLMYSFNHSYYLPDYIINSLPVGSNKKTSKDGMGFGVTKRNLGVSQCL